MNYKHLSLRCDCGEVPERLVEVGFSDDHHLVVHWWCEKCERIVYTTKPLTECWLECPAKDHSLDRVLAEWSTSAVNAAEVKSSATGSSEPVEEGDAEFLRSIGASM